MACGCSSYRAALLFVFASYCALLTALSNGDLEVIQHILAPLSGRSTFQHRPCGAPACVANRLVATPQEILRGVFGTVVFNESVAVSLRLRPTSGNPSAARDAVRESLEVLPIGEQLHIAVKLQGSATEDETDEACYAIWMIAVGSKRWVQVQFVALPPPFAQCAPDYSIYDRWLKVEGALSEAHRRSIALSKRAIWYSNTAIAERQLPPNRNGNTVLPVLRAASLSAPRTAEWLAELEALGPTMRPTFLFSAEDVLVLGSALRLPAGEFLRKALRFNVAPLALVVGQCDACGSDGGKGEACFGAEGGSYVAWSGLSNVGETIARSTLVVCLAASNITIPRVDYAEQLTEMTSVVIDVSPAISSASLVG